MGKTKSLLSRVGSWPDGSTPANHSPELTVAARRLAAAALEELSRLGVAAELDQAGKAHFRSVRVPLPAARLTIECQGDLIELCLIELATAALKREQESGG